MTQAQANQRKVLSPKLQGLGKQLVMQLGTVIRTSRIHDPTNQALLIATEKLKDTINTLWAALGTVRLQFVEDLVYLNDVRLRIEQGMAKNVTNLREDLALHGLGGLDFQRPVDSATLKEFLILLAREPEGEEDFDRLKVALNEMKELALDLLKEKTFADEGTVDEIRVDRKTFALQTYAKAVVAAREAHTLVGRGEDPLASKLSVTRVVQDLIDIATERVNFLLKLGSIKSTDDYLYNHAANTCVTSLVIGKSMKIDRLRLVDLGTSALLADLGFGLIPPQRLNRPEEFSEREREEIRQEMARGIRALVGRGRINDSSMRRAIVAFEHHTPYLNPDTQEPNPLHVFSRIVAVADAYDALTTQRPWREGYPADEALRILTEEAGTKFDPIIVKILTNLMGLYPMGSAVKLDSGEIAVVYHNSNDPALFEKPWVRVLVDPLGQRITKTTIRNLAEHQGVGGRIVGTVRPDETKGMDLGAMVML